MSGTSEGTFLKLTFVAWWVNLLIDIEYPLYSSGKSAKNHSVFTSDLKVICFTPLLPLDRSISSISSGSTPSSSKI